MSRFLSVAFLVALIGYDVVQQDWSSITGLSIFFVLAIIWEFVRELKSVNDAGAQEEDPPACGETIN